MVLVGDFCILCLPRKSEFCVPTMMVRAPPHALQLVYSSRAMWDSVKNLCLCLRVCTKDVALVKPPSSHASGSKAGAQSVSLFACNV